MADLLSQSTSESTDYILYVWVFWFDNHIFCYFCLFSWLKCRIHTEIHRSCDGISITHTNPLKRFSCPVSFGWEHMDIASTSCFHEFTYVSLYEYFFLVHFLL